jgi:lysophospholipase L1-like esterase
MPAWSSRLVLLFLCAALAACGGSTPRMDKLADDAVVLAFGDSLTYGTGAAREDSYPAQLERGIKRKVVNAGVPGETSAAGLERLGDVLEEVKPALLILCHGGNDFLRKMDEAGAASNVRAMIAMARQKDIAVVLLATPKPTLPPSVPAFYRQIAEETGVGFEEAVVKKVLLDRDLKSDLVHPNAEGYRLIAGSLEKMLRRSGAL